MRPITMPANRAHCHASLQQIMKTKLRRKAKSRGIAVDGKGAHDEPTSLKNEQRL
jgi:hypothetical protein